MATGPRTAVIIAAHRFYPTLELCLRGFLRVVHRPQDLIFVDNGSEENLAAGLKERFPAITVMRLPENRLFCGGYNAGIRKAISRNCDFVLLANADTEVVHTGFLDALLDAAGRWPSAAFLGPRVYLHSTATIQNTGLRFPRIIHHLVAWLPWRLAPAMFVRIPEGETEVAFLNGVCVLCRVEALRSTGLMDESLGGYFEDADWSWRARERGWTSVHVPFPGVIHHEEAVGYEHYSFKSFLLKRNLAIWFLKAGRTKSAWIYAGASVLLAWLRMQVSTGRGRRLHRDFLKRLLASYRTTLAAGGHSSPGSMDCESLRAGGAC